MVSVRFLHHVTLNGVAYTPGDVVEFEAALAATLVYAMRAEYTDGPPSEVPGADPFPQYVRDSDLENAGTPTRMLLEALFVTASTLANVATTGQYADLLGTPVLANLILEGTGITKTVDPETGAVTLNSTGGGGGSAWSAAVDAGDSSVLVLTFTPGDGADIDPTDSSVLILSI